ncbi:MAG: hypothetical protein HRU15_00020 [Planctomycetes bacterium]|nr:hypothetical protein [Planctomycetota bacterium]
MRSLFIVLMLLSTVLASAERPKNVREWTPKGVTPDTEQRALVYRLASQQSKIQVAYNGQGGVRCFMASALAEKNDKQVAIKGLTDEDLQQMAQQFTDLRALRLYEHVHLSDDAFKALEQWPDLEVFCVERHIGDRKGSFQQYLKPLKRLRWLELKHCSKQGDSRIDTLPHYPDLIRLELDDASAQAKCIAFLEKNPQIIDLEIHRTQMNNEQMRKILNALPKLKRFHFKQSFGEWQRKKEALLPLTVACFAALKDHQHLEILDIIRWNDSQVFWQDGIEHVAHISSLKRVEFIRPPHKDAKDHPAAVQLFSLRPELHPKAFKGKLVRVLQQEYPGIMP